MHRSRAFPCHGVVVGVEGLRLARFCSDPPHTGPEADRVLWQFFKATTPVIALGLMAVVAVLCVSSGQDAAASVRAQVGSWSADHKWSEQLGRDSYKRSLSTMDKLRAIPAGFKMAQGTSKLGWGGSEEFMTDDAFKVASNQGDVFNPIYGMTPPPINKGYLDEIEEAQGLQAQETADNGALAMGEEITGKTYYTNDTFWREGPAGSYGYMHSGAYYH